MIRWRQSAVLVAALASAACEGTLAPSGPAPRDVVLSIDEADIYDDQSTATEFPTLEEIPEALLTAKVVHHVTNADIRGRDMAGSAFMEYKANLADVRLILRASRESGSSQVSPEASNLVHHWLPTHATIDVATKMTLGADCGYSGEGVGKYFAAVRYSVLKVGTFTYSQDYAAGTSPTAVQPPCTSSPSGEDGGGSGGESGGDGGGGSGGESICYDYYEWDLTTGDVTLLFSTCPSYTASVAPVSTSLPPRVAPVPESRAGRGAAHHAATLAANASRNGSAQVAPNAPAVPFALLDQSLPSGAKAVAVSRRDDRMPQVVLVSRSATAADLAIAVGALSHLRGVSVRDGRVEAVAVPRAGSTASSALVGWSQTIIRRLQSAPVVDVPNHGRAPVVYAIVP